MEKQNPPKNEPSCVVFVRNLPQNTSQIDLQKTFEKFGPVEKVLILNQKT